MSVNAKGIEIQQHTLYDNIIIYHIESNLQKHTLKKLIRRKGKWQIC